LADYRFCRENERAVGKGEEAKMKSHTEYLVFETKKRREKSRYRKFGQGYKWKFCLLAALRWL